MIRITNEARGNSRGAGDVGVGRDWIRGRGRNKEKERKNEGAPVKTGIKECGRRAWTAIEGKMK